jgi:uncharacterized protein YbjT (DUF2867 family)
VTLIAITGGTGFVGKALIALVIPQELERRAP